MGRSVLKLVALACVAIGIVCGVGALATASLSGPECNGQVLRSWEYCVEDGRPASFEQKKEAQEERVRTLGWASVALLISGIVLAVIVAATDRPAILDHTVEHRPSDAELRAIGARQAAAAQQQRRYGPPQGPPQPPPG